LIDINTTDIAEHTRHQTNVMADTNNTAQNSSTTHDPPTVMADTNNTASANKATLDPRSCKVSDVLEATGIKGRIVPAHRRSQDKDELALDADRSVFRKQLADHVRTLAEVLGAQYVNFFDYEGLQKVQPQAHAAIYIVPVGIYAVDDWRTGDDVHLVCLTNARFWEIFSENLQMGSDFKPPAGDTLELTTPTWAPASDAHPVLHQIRLLCRDPMVCYSLPLFYCTFY
jgi:hypothetical protein